VLINLPLIDSNQRRLVQLVDQSAILTQLHASACRAPP